MSGVVNLQDLVAIDGLLHADQIPTGNAFDLLGKSLEAWLKELLAGLGANNGQPVVKGQVAKEAILRGDVYIAAGATVEPTAMISGPCYIGPGSEVRHGAYIRGNVYVGAKCVVGHTTEVKGSVFFDGAKAGHFAYVGDSVLGRGVNLGAGTKLANFKFTGDDVYYRDPKSKQRVNSGLRKFGALIGDGCNTGCNAVLYPGSIMLPRTAILPCVAFRGTLTTGLAR